MKTYGFACGRSGTITIGTPFGTQYPNSTYPVVSSYVSIPTGGTEGGAVYINSAGETCWVETLFVGLNPLAAIEILASGTVNGVTKTTTAVPTGWLGSINS
jgi:hypothetical protein